MNYNRISRRIAGSLSDRPDYGTGDAAVPRGQVSFISEENDEYCVRSDKNPDWSGGCYDTKSEAKDRLKQVEVMKHINEGK